MRCAVALSILGLTWLSSSGTAFAQTEDAKKRARSLFFDGAAAVDAGKPADGLPKLEEAEKLFHAPTHVLYIARAQARLGRLIDARATYGKLIEEKLAAGANQAFVDAQSSGRTELADLERRTPKLIVRVEPADARDLGVVMNGATFEGSRLGSAFPVDPGVYVFEAKATGLEGPKVTVDAAERTTTEVRLLLREIGAPRADVDPKSVVVTRPDDAGPADSSAGLSTVQIASIPMMGLGGAGLVVGGVMLGLHFANKSDADALATCAPSCTDAEIDEIVSLDEQGAGFGTTGIIGLSAGGALLGTGIVLFLASGDDSAPAAGRLHVRPVIGAGFAGLEGSF